MTLNEQHVPNASTSYVPSINSTTVGPKNGPHKVLESIQTIPYVIPGYTASTPTMTGDGATKAKAYMNNHIPDSGFISFITSNKDINIKYEYGVDTTKNFAVKVVDKVWQNDSTTPGTYSHTTNTVKSQNNRTANNVVGNVLTNITGITANGNYVDITGSATVSEHLPTQDISCMVNILVFPICVNLLHPKVLLLERIATYQLCRPLALHLLFQATLFAYSNLRRQRLCLPDRLWSLPCDRVLYQDRGLRAGHTPPPLKASVFQAFSLCNRNLQPYLWVFFLLLHILN